MVYVFFTTLWNLTPQVFILGPICRTHIKPMLDEVWLGLLISYYSCHQLDLHHFPTYIGVSEKMFDYNTLLSICRPHACSTTCVKQVGVP